MTVYYRNNEEEGGGGGKARPSLDYLRDRSGAGGSLSRQPPPEVSTVSSVHICVSSALCYFHFSSDTSVNINCIYVLNCQCKC